MIKAITLDIDNTLLDFIQYKRAAVKAMVEALKKHKVRNITEKQLFDFYITYDIESDNFISKFLKKYKIYSEILEAAMLNAYLVSKYKHLKTYPGVRPTLKRLKQKGIKLAIVTDAPRFKAITRLEYLNLTEYFDIIVSYEDVNRKKPSTLIFKRALKQLKVQPQHTLHLGDYREKDILGAKRTGMQNCIARYGDLKIGKKVWADFYIDKFSDILKLL